MAKVLFMGKETFTKGQLPQIGQTLPTTTACSSRLEDMPINQLGGPLIINIFPSIDTSVCAKSMQTFIQECQNLSGIKLFHLSKDLPFSLERFNKEHKLEAATLSCFRSDLAASWGLEISSGPLRGLCARCVIVADENLVVRYIQLVDEISHEPDYRAAIDAVIEVM